MDRLLQLPSAHHIEINFPSLAKYKINQDHAAEFFADFSLVLRNFALSKTELRQHANLMEVKDVPGVYFLLMRLHGCLYKIYAGKARCLPRRLNDYTNEFQVHSPNDYKLQFFRNFILKQEPDSEFDLYFQKCTKDTYTQREAVMIRKYAPLMNERGEGDRTLILDAFSAYFSQSFKRKLS